MIEISKFGSINSEELFVYTISNSSGNSVKICNYGGTVTSLKLKNATGQLIDVVLGFDSFEEYLSCVDYFGCIIGRYANRIGNAHFKINDDSYYLNANDGQHSLHGGLKGFDKKVWTPKIIKEKNNIILELSYFSVDGEENFPGNLDVKVRYSFSETNDFKIEYSAVTDKACYINLTNHSYFNLNGQGLILDHDLQVNSSYILETDAELIPTGRYVDVSGGAYDFRKMKPIGQNITEVLNGRVGYDNNYVIDNYCKGKIQTVAIVQSAKTGLRLSVLSDMPGIQIYSGNFLDGSYSGKSE